MQDTIGTERKSSYSVKKVHISNYIDFNFKLTKKLTLIASLGLKIENRDGHTKIKNSTQLNYILSSQAPQLNTQFNNTQLYNQNRFPINFKLLILPQLLIELNEFNIKIQIHQDILNINRYIDAIDVGSINYITQTGIGIIISTKHKSQKRQSEYDTLYSSE